MTKLEKTLAKIDALMIQARHELTAQLKHERSRNMDRLENELSAAESGYRRAARPFFGLKAPRPETLADVLCDGSQDGK